MSVIEKLGEIVSDYAERGSLMQPTEILDAMDKIAGYSVALVDEICDARDEWRAAKSAADKQAAKDYFDTITLFLKQVNNVFDSARSRQSMYKTYNAKNIL